MKFSDLISADIRLLMLQTLEQGGGYSHNEYVLADALAMLGHRVSGDRVRTELAWLAEQGLVALSDVSGIMVARLTERGQDVSLGRGSVPGVKRPRPGAWHA